MAAHASGFTDVKDCWTQTLSDERHGAGWSNCCGSDSFHARLTASLGSPRTDAAEAAPRGSTWLESLRHATAETLDKSCWMEFLSELAR
eukprot:1235688-Amphidinium_carterae.1